MIPTSHVSAPALGPGVLRRLKRLDDRLRLTWHLHQLDPLSGDPVITRYGIVDPTTGISTPGGQPIEAPGWYLWRVSDTCSHHFFVKSFVTFGNREVLGLEADLARRIPHHLLGSYITERIDARRKREIAVANEERRYRTDQNRSLNHDILFEGKRSLRDAKIFSGGGITRRSTPGLTRMDRSEFAGKADEDA